MEYCTYITYHLFSPIYYVGKGKAPSVESGAYKGSGVTLNRLFKKYPKEQWRTSIICRWPTSEEALAHEALLVDEDLLRDPNCLNVIPGGLASPMDSQAVRDKVSATRKGIVFSDEWKRKLSVAGKGQAISAEHRQHLSIACTGWKQSDEVRARISASKVGKPRSEETKRKISETKRLRFAAKIAALSQ